MRFLEDIALPVLEKPLPDPAEDCYREQVKNKILLDQEDIDLVRLRVGERHRPNSDGQRWIASLLHY